MAAHRGFIAMPDSWLLDYDQNTAPEGFSKRRSFPMVFQGLAFIALNTLLFIRVPYATTDTWLAIAALIAIPVLLLILVADLKTRIIPDQLTLLLIVPGLVKVVGRLASGESFLRAAGRPFAAALIAGGSLLLIGLLGQWLLKKEAMGMGDVKMISAAAFLVGFDHLLELVMLSFLTAAIIAIPLLVIRHVQSRKMKNTTEPMDDQADRSEDDADEHVSDDDSAIAFGPFIAIATLLIILFEQHIDQLALAYWALFMR